ncbi:MAG: DUF3326 domain-containing protein [Pirellulales bacterium]|nr:DUF3326 domain-containing protein [Pirellulales bacterium]
MNIVLVIPTGIGCEIGGHAGDANPVAKLMGACCDNLILHPNVVNASDVNEMPENSWYVEGSTLDRFLRGEIYLEKPRLNKILIAVNQADWQSINAVSGARATIGANVEIVELKKPLELIAQMKNGLASGEVINWKPLVEQVQQYEFDALGIATPITIDEATLRKYFEVGGVNPVGGVEAVASKLISSALNKPVAHGPVDYAIPGFHEIVEPRKAIEIVTLNFIHCLLKGLNKAPRLSNMKKPGSLGAEDVDLLVSPMGCLGEPHKACLEREIPIVVVRENKSVLHEYEDGDGRFIFVENYIEAAGLVMAIKTGIHPSSVRRPLEPTTVLSGNH